MLRSVPFELDGKNYDLRFTIGVSSEFEKLTKIKLSEHEGEFTIDEYMTMLCIMMKKQNMFINKTKLIELLDESDMSINDVINTVEVAYVAGVTGRDVSELQDVAEKLKNVMTPIAKKN